MRALRKLEGANNADASGISTLLDDRCAIFVPALRSDMSTVFFPVTYN